MRRQAFTLYFLPLLFCFFFSLEVNAQRSMDDLGSQATFRKAQELFEAKHYASAQVEFQNYLKTGELHDLRAEAKYYIALSALELFQDDAGMLLTQFMEEYPEHPRATKLQFYLGRFRFRQKDYEKAIDAFDKISEYDLEEGDKTAFLFMKGYSFFKLNKYDQAKESFAKAKDGQDENSQLSAYYYGFIAYEQNRYSDAIIEFEKLKATKKFKASMPVYISQIYLLQGKYDQVISSGEAALLDKETEKAQDVELSVAEAYFQKKDYGKAMEHFAAYSAAGASLNEHYLYEYGFSLYNKEKYDEALKAFSAINVKDDSLGQNIAYHRAGSLLKTGDKRGARIAYESASKQKFDKKIQEQSLLNYAKLSYDLNLQQEAISGLKQFLADFGASKSSTEAKEILSQILLSANNPKEALEVIESIPNRTEKLEDAYQKILYLYGLEIFKGKEYEKAITYFNKSIKHPEDKKTKALCYFWIGESMYKLGKMEDAKTNYKNFLFVSESQETPYFNVVNYNLGYTFFKLEDYFYANVYFRKYLNGEKESSRNARITDAQLRSADCEFVLKNYEDASRDYQIVIDAHAPESDYALYQKGMIQGLKGKPNDKINSMRSLTKKYPTSNYLDDALYAIAEEYKKQEQYPDAINAYLYLNQNYPKNPYYRAAMLNIGQSYYNTENDAKALQYLKAIVKLYPYSSEARDAKNQVVNIYIDNHQTDSIETFLSSTPNNNFKNSSVDSLLYASAFTAIKDNDCEAAMKSLDRYLVKYPEGIYSVDANYYLGKCEMDAKKNEKSIQHFNFVINKSPNTFMERALRYSGYLYYSEANYGMSAKRFAQLEEIAASNQNILYAVLMGMRANYRQKNYDRTIAIANKLLNLAYAEEGNKLEAQLYIGKSNLDQNQLEQALSAFEKVHKSDKNEMGAEALYNVAYINFLKEKYNEAEDLVYKVNDDYPNVVYWKAKAFILLADIYMKKGDAFTAKNTLQSIIDNYKGDDLKKVAQDKLNTILETEKANGKAKEIEKNKTEEGE